MWLCCCYTHSCNVYWFDCSQVYSSDKWVPVRLPGVVGGAICPRPRNTSETQSAEVTKMAETHQIRKDEQTCCESSSLLPSHRVCAADGTELTTQGGQQCEGVLVQCEPSTKQHDGVEKSVSGVSMEDSHPKPEQGTEVDNCDSEGDGGSGSDDVDEDEGWITPDNIDQARTEMGGCMGEELGDVRVGCMTTDFAMQVSEGC